MASESETDPPPDERHPRLEYQSGQPPQGMPEKFIARGRGDTRAKWQVSLGCILPMFVGIALLILIPAMARGCMAHSFAPGP